MVDYNDHSSDRLESKECFNIWCVLIIQWCCIRNKLNCNNILTKIITRFSDADYCCWFFTPFPYVVLHVHLLMIVIIRNRLLCSNTQSLLLWLLLVPHTSKILSYFIQSIWIDECIISFLIELDELAAESAQIFINAKTHISHYWNRNQRLSNG